MINTAWSNMIDISELNKILGHIELLRTCGKVIFPAKESIFYALDILKPEDVKVIILGQDPYPGVDKEGTPHAMGLAFSSNSKVEIPASLKNVFDELFLDLKVYNTSANLESWAKQGVLLLNTTLTVSKGVSNSHVSIGWDTITDSIISGVSQLPQPLVFMLWGNNAQAKGNLIRKSEKNLILEAAHPSPLSARRGFIGCKHFSKANEFLSSFGIKPINWEL